MPSVGSAGTYTEVTTDAQGRVTSGSTAGGGGGTAKGGIFTKVYTTGAAAASAQAFKITRPTGAMTFDVWFTCDFANDTSIAKKYTVAKQYGNATKIYYNKIIDTGAGTGNTGGVDHDFEVDFDITGTSSVEMEANITPRGVGSQKIGITIDLGYGDNDAVVVMN